MAVPIGPAGCQPTTTFRLTSGLELLDQWSEQATQVEKNIVHQVLFAVVDRSVFTGYDVVDDVTKTMEFFVLCKCDLTVKIRVHDFDTCGITYIGQACEAPGLDQAAPETRAPVSGSGPDTSRPEKEEDVPHSL